MVIAVDFDGTIVEHRYPRIGAEIPFAVETLKLIQTELKHTLILWTVREGELLEEAMKFCTDRGLYFYAINSNEPGSRKGEHSRKIVADLYLDDRNFGGLPEENSSPDSSRFVILPVGYEATTTSGKGTKRGPAAIIDASRNMELYDEELRSEPFLHGIHTAGDLLFHSIVPEAMVETVEEAAAGFVSKGKCLISLGGEHSISSLYRSAKEALR